ncbi:dihydroxyacetone kinase phosphoryl donor subunit DhaM [Agromyces rhizosphaerae]|uniref:dihydroxyacetone kinase phosphoryl donor subunit DhaM n=1 Tax=Agromyces rhizosphaerae TaxID=88374 RepID=UPI002491A879|nr:dihydroxyacetone kinase phosphoryl donor subunit DhaM [Agromyces rhizosphaerae]
MTPDPHESRVGLVFVSHSAAIADGLVQLARQMAEDVVMVPAGGTDDGGIGTSFAKVSEGIAAADAGRGAAVLFDLGSAVLTAETALDFVDDEQRARVRVVDAPLVEGGVAAAVVAQTGGSLDEVVAAATAAGGQEATSGDAEWDPGRATDPVRYERTVTLRNEAGLHARPAAEFVRLASTFDAHVRVDGKDAKSLLAIMSLGAVRGDAVTISSDDDRARPAVDALAELVESGFGEA